MASPATPDTRPIGELRFLLVEDHAFQRRQLAMLLADLGARHVHEAANGPAGLARLSDNTQEPVDIVISDLDMPGMDGMEFIRHLCATGVPVSLILASAMEPSLIHSVEKMAQAYGIHLLGAVEKPATADSLARLIARHPGERAWQPRKAPTRVLPLSEIIEGLTGGQFHAVYQPKVSLATRAVHGMEALARWRHPERGTLPPYAFIKPMEDSGLIDELTWVMLAESARACAAWRRAGHDLTVAVNLSSASLADLSLAERVTAIVQDAGLSPPGMVLEVTESAATSDIGRALENLTRLRMKGFRLAIDDYGTGYASMQQLTRVPFTELKIDQAFVRNAGAEHALSGRVVLESSLEIARRLKLTSVAEGVESGADWEVLKALGCDLAQGYFVAKPMEEARVAGWLQGWTGA